MSASKSPAFSQSAVYASMSKTSPSAYNPVPPRGDWCIGNTVVSKTATPGSIPGSPVTENGSTKRFPGCPRI